MIFTLFPEIWQASGQVIKSL